MTTFKALQTNQTFICCENDHDTPNLTEGEKSIGRKRQTEGKVVLETLWKKMGKTETAKEANMADITLTTYPGNIISSFTSGIHLK